MSLRYYGISQFLKENYQCKYVKLSIDGGFTCPNRDGKIGIGGCIFCSERGSGDFTGSIIEINDGDVNGPMTQTISSQIDAQKRLLSEKWDSKHYIAYFQSYSNTYAAPDILMKRFNEALSNEGVDGLAIATRADCLDDEIIEHLKQYRNLSVFWIELGLQTTLESSRKFLNLHLDMPLFESVFRKLKDAEIPVVLHVIAGLPGESKEDFLSTIDKVNTLKPFGIKIHMLNILKNTSLADYYRKNPFELLTLETYIEWVCDALENLNPDITIHRLTGDGPKDLLIAPMWIRHKRAVLNGIQKEMTHRNSFQGSHYEYK